MCTVCRFVSGWLSVSLLFTGECLAGVGYVTGARRWVGWKERVIHKGEHAVLCLPLFLHVG